ncbi:MAG: helix-turn-helix transcriptional regulator [Prevotellaceae bacterium]|jgi:DNA-binding Xre family transcriptional regulator|nr:helix-turn-helix transcriptional regulator [Prevotellaceae bacterium]
MKNSKEKSFVIENLLKIMNDKKLTKVAFSELVGMPEPKWNKIANGKQNLSVNELSEIAEKLRMKEIDILTYPKKFAEVGTVNSDVKAQITVELKEDLKGKVLELVFGNKNLELLNN